MSSTAVLRLDQPNRSEIACEDAVVPRASGDRVTLRDALVMVVAVSAVYVGWHLMRGWMPFDDGALAQSAERSMRGELPHRDFDEIYTGGLTELNAVAFRLLGVTLRALRLVLFAAFLAWVPAVFYIASRFTRPIVAASVTLLAVVWSLPNYTAAMPSWYNLFLATWGVAALLRYLEENQRRWLVAAGIAGGLSVLVKVVGLYYVAGVLLFLVFHAHATARATSRAASKAEPGDGSLYACGVTVALLLFVGGLMAVVRHQLRAAEVVHFVMPAALVAALLARNEWREPAGPSRARAAALGQLAAPFLAGVTVPVILFLIPYAQSGALGDLVNGVFVVPTQRFGVAYEPILPLQTMWTLAPLALLVAWTVRAASTPRTRQITALASVLALILFSSGRSPAIYSAVWNSARNLIPALAIAGVLLLARERTDDVDTPLRRPRVVLLLSVTALCGVVQFPYAAPNYFCYVAPLAILLALSLASYLPVRHRAVAALVVVFYAAFAVLRSNGTPLQSMGRAYEPPYPATRLSLDRGGIEIPRVHAAAYELLVPMLRARARGGCTWASPDAPEIYFLSGLCNPTRSLFDFLASRPMREDDLLQALDAHAVRAIVLNRVPSFSPPLANHLVQRLEQRFPYARDVGPFQLRWRS